MSPGAVEVDALGLLCPLPVLRTEQAARRLAPGDELVVLADDPRIVDDLPAWCAGAGHDVVSLSEEATPVGRRRFSVRIRLGRGAVAQDRPPAGRHSPR